MTEGKWVVNICVREVSGDWSHDHQCSYRTGPSTPIGFTQIYLYVWSMPSTILNALMDNYMYEIIQPPDIKKDLTHTVNKGQEHIFQKRPLPCQSWSSGILQKNFKRRTWGLKAITPMSTKMYELKMHISFTVYSLSTSNPDLVWCFSSVQVKFKVIIPT